MSLVALNGLAANSRCKVDVKCLAAAPRRAGNIRRHDGRLRKRRCSTAPAPPRHRASRDATKKFADACSILAPSAASTLRLECQSGQINTSGKSTRHVSSIASCAGPNGFKKSYKLRRSEDPWPYERLPKNGHPDSSQWPRETKQENGGCHEVPEPDPLYCRRTVGPRLQLWQAEHGATPTGARRAIVVVFGCAVAKLVR
jgi:hypothetical protein